MDQIAYGLDNSLNSISEQGFKGTVLNQACPSRNRMSLKILAILLRIIS